MTLSRANKRIIWPKKSTELV